MTGGQLSDTKCKYHATRWLPQNALKKCQDINGVITFTNNDGKAIHIQQEKYNKTIKYLGVHNSPNGNTSTEFSKCIEITKVFHNNLLKSNLQSNEAITAYRAIWRAKIRYSISNIWFTEQECKKIQSMAITALLPKIKINRNFPRVIVYGNRSLGGLGIPTTYQEQGMIAIKCLVGNLRVKTSLSKLLIITLQNSQLELGSQTKILERIQHIPVYITETWCTKIWNFLLSNNMEIHVKELDFLNIQRENDVFIMDKIKCDHSRLKQINKCRMFLNVIYLSDLVEPGGVTLDRHVVYHRRPVKSKYKWPDPLIPTIDDWKAWKWAIRKFISSDMMVINESLGKWNTNSHIQYPYVASQFRNNLYSNDMGIWYEHKSTYLPSVFKIEKSEISEVPKTLIPAHAIRESDNLVIINWVGNKISMEMTNQNHDIIVTKDRFHPEYKKNPRKYTSPK